MALALAMCGIERFILVDDDVLEPANIVRHVADMTHVGQSKVEAVAQLIRQRNPQATVQKVVGRIESHFDLLAQMDVLAVGVDGEGAKFSINEACLKANLIAIYAGVYERGEGGDVVTIRPYQGPCYACWAESLREGFIPPSPDGSDVELDYGQRRPDGGLDAEAGLWLDVVRVANTQATVVLHILLEDTAQERRLPANTLLIASREIELIEGHITPTFGSEWVDISRNPQCLVCGTPPAQSASVSLDQLLQQATAQDDDDDDSQVLKRQK